VQQSFVPLPPPKVKRGGIVRFLLMLLALGSILSSLAGVIFVATGHDDDSLGPSQLPKRVMFLALCGLLNVGFTTGIWGYKKWGVYGIVVVSLFAFVPNWRIGGSPMAIPCLIAPLLLAVVAGLTWGEFD
jgi:hypothetical protein